MIVIHGFQKLTLLDYPGKVACTVFLGGCNFRCPFCHNSGLVLHPEREPMIEEQEVLNVLKKRQGILEGVCITGGEPTLYVGLETLIRNIKELGYYVKLDTNGYRSEMLKHLMDLKLIDYVAMDIKNSPDKYKQTTGVSNLQMEHIRKSVSYLMNGRVEYEFRTTLCRELHTEDDILMIGNWLEGCSRYYLQNYQESEHVIQPIFHGFQKEELEHFAQILRRFVKAAEVRGVD